MTNWIYDKLCDYHCHFPRGENIPGLLDVLVFACKAQGLTAQQVTFCQFQTCSDALLNNDLSIALLGSFRPFVTLRFLEPDISASLSVLSISLKPSGLITWFMGMLFHSQS